MIPPLPVATYRLQVTSQFGFDAAAEIVPYLKSLGVTHLYASPFFKARPGSTHGYDIVDHSAFNPELGGEPAFLRMSDALQREGMGLIVDFVPNHMCVEGVRNDWWWDALEFGPYGRHAPHFDIAWSAVPGRPRVLLPILGKPYGECLEAGEIQLAYQDGGFSIHYYDHHFPIRPGSYPALLRTMMASAGKEGAGRQLEAIIADFGARARMTADDAQQMKAALARAGGAEQLIRAGLAAYDAKQGEAALQRLHRLLERQHYRLAFWRVAGSQINYRRFFDINSLAGLRVERAATFAALHPLVARLLRAGRLQGLRIDHIDGLYDPAQYCARLLELCQECAAAPVYIVVEKILGEGERLADWPGVAGTTGYEWMNAISRVFVDARGLDRLHRCWRETEPAALPFEEMLRAAKTQVVDTLFAGEFNVLARLLARIAAGHYSTRDHPADMLRRALRAYIVEFPIYRTYAADGTLSVADRGIVEGTIEAARRRWPVPDNRVFEFLRQVLVLDGALRGSHSAARLRQFVMKLQQLTGPVMAKSLEDTSLYRDHRLLALNEVGNDPALPPLTVSEFHARMRGRCADHPHGLTATATHDTKRGEDARMRILAIADLAEEWSALVQSWHTQNAQHLRRSNGGRAPSAAHEYMLYQSMVGVWPMQSPAQEVADRLCAYAVKAAREGKTETSWLDPDEAYETALQDFVRRLLDPARSQAFLQSFARFAERCALLGALHSLAQVALKATMPGVPDFYQGTELWDLSLVDPDNRRPVDFAARREVARGSENPDWNRLAERWRDGAIKLALTRRLLAIRNTHPSLFAEGGYTPFESGREDVVGFTRAHAGDTILVLAMRRLAQPTEGGLRWPDPKDWQGEVKLPANTIAENLLVHDERLCGHRDSSIPLSTILGRLPVAVLHLRAG